MKSLQQQLREILDSASYPVDPQHEAAFRTMLLQDRKRRRRNILWFTLCLLGMLLAGYGVIYTLKKPAMPEQTEQKTTPAIAEVPPPKEDPSIALSETGQITGDRDASQNQTMQASPGKEHTASIGGNTSSAPDQGTSRDAITTYDNLNKNAGTNTPQPDDETIQGHMIQRSPENVKATPAEITQVETETTTPDQSRVASAYDARILHSVEYLNTDLAQLTYSSALPESGPIVPASRRPGEHRLHFGISGAISPATDLFAKNDVGSGQGFQLGGFVTYTLSPRLQLRADAGFVKHDGGFTYMKESTTEEYGFTSVRTEHFLSVQKLYSGFFATELGLKRGNQMYCLGLQGQYLYGARGDIQAMQYGQDLQPMVSYTADNVWLETGDMRKIALHATAGVRLRIQRRIELAALMHIPLTQSLKHPDGNAFYQYRINSYRAYPQFTLSYQINQQ